MNNDFELELIKTKHFLLRQIRRRMNEKIMLNEPCAAKVPTTKSKESPGRKGVMTRPVSRKIIMKRNK